MDFFLYGLSGGGDPQLVLDRDTQLVYSVSIKQLNAGRGVERVSSDRKNVVLLSRHDVKKLITKE